MYKEGVPQLYASMVGEFLSLFIIIVDESRMGYVLINVIWYYRIWEYCKKIYVII